MENTNQELLLEDVFITETAAQQIRDIIDSQNLDEELYVRIYMQGGCGSIGYGMALDSHVNQEDYRGEVNGLKVIVDPISITYVRGATVDFEGGDKPGFRISNPNVDLSALGGSCGGGSCGGGSCGSGGCC